jgi:NAD(P)-dependent dehydrogenase (short-subunit alcohol dehydrogenase family)
VVEKYRGRVALVTGAASGLGRGIARLLAKSGVRVIAADIDAAALAAVGGGAIVTEALDVRDTAAFHAAAEGAVARFGRIDYLFNIAGVVVAGELLEVTPEAWRRVLDVNLMGTVNGIAAVYPGMARARSGHIVNMSSVMGLLPAPLLAPYAASKAAIVSLSESLRLETDHHGVRVTLVCPGFVRTEIYRRAEAPARFGPDLGSLVPFKSLEVDGAVRSILNGVARNRARIVFPAFWRWYWRLWRLSPALLAPAGRITLARVRALIDGAQKR